MQFRNRYLMQFECLQSWIGCIQTAIILAPDNMYVVVSCNSPHTIERLCVDYDLDNGREPII